MCAPARVDVVHPGGYLQCTSYLIEAPGGLILVDPGSGVAEREVIANIERTGRGLTDVQAVLITHCHYDHARGAYRFRRHGARIIASPRTAAILRAGGHQVWPEYPEYVIPTEIDQTVADGESVGLCGISLHVLHTPGHTEGCASFMVETDGGLAVFTGDLISSRGHPGWAGSEGFCTDATLRSIQHLLEAGPARAFSGHAVIAQPASEWLNAALKLGRSGQWELDDQLHPEKRPPEFFERRSDRSSDAL